MESIVLFEAKEAESFNDYISYGEVVGIARKKEIALRIFWVANLFLKEGILLILWFHHQ
jgi:hypothetical protein